MRRFHSNGPHVFVSYSFGNPAASRIAEMLTDDGFKVEIVADTTLLGSASLDESLMALIQNSEVVIPVIDHNARNSIWVEREIELAKENDRLIIPVVHDVDGPPEFLADTPYLKDTRLEALAEAVLRHYFLSPVLEHDPLTYPTSHFDEYFRSLKPPIRLLFDSNSYFDCIEDAAHKHPPFTTDESIERQLQKSLKEKLNSIRQSLPWIEIGFKYLRSALLSSLANFDNYKYDVFARAACRFSRLVFGQHLLYLAEQFPPARVDFWGNASDAIGDAQRSIDGWRETLGQHICRGNYELKKWSLYLHEPNLAHHELVEGVFCADDNYYTRCLIPQSGDTQQCLQALARPDSFIDKEVWAGMVIPQLAQYAVMQAVRYNDHTYFENTRWDRIEYTSSALP